mmetsp:Transcript_120715/g.385473  ORF Transcript_120715/g.385473 Transcript_120715/m.385473 type:complete len:300 (+) Transcript_120715:167-1066(+)
MSMVPVQMRGHMCVCALCFFRVAQHLPDSFFARPVHVPLVAWNHLLQFVHVHHREEYIEGEGEEHAHDAGYECLVPHPVDMVHVLRLRGLHVVLVFHAHNLVSVHDGLDVSRHEDLINQLVHLRNERQRHGIQHQVLKAQRGGQPPCAQPPQEHRNEDLWQKHQNRDGDFDAACEVGNDDGLIIVVALRRFAFSGLRQLPQISQITERLAEVDVTCSSPDAEEGQVEVRLRQRQLTQLVGAIPGFRPIVEQVPRIVEGRSMIFCIQLSDVHHGWPTNVFLRAVQDVELHAGIDEEAQHH